MNDINVWDWSNRRLFHRRDFLARMFPAMGGGAMLSAWPRSSRAWSLEGRRLKYVGWQVGVTYQASQRGGLDRDYLIRLLDEMAENRMNFLSLMMNSTVENDPLHEGWCWPVRNPRLKGYWDSGSINGQPSTEYVHDVIVEADHRGIEIMLFTNGFWWTPEKIKKGYPSAGRQAFRDAMGKLHHAPYWFCPDSPEAWQVALDEVADLLTYYKHPNVIGYGFEMLADGGCFCKWTQEKFRKETGSSMLNAKAPQLSAWRARRVRGYLKEYGDHIRQLMTKATVWLHADCVYAGHEPEGLKASGVDYVFPLVAHMPTTKARLHTQLNRCSPMPCVLHFCTRDRRPKNYDLWIKTPKIIEQITDWILDYPGDNLVGLMFFNESATSPHNKKAVYEQIKRFAWGG